MTSSSTSEGDARAAWEREYAEVHAYTTSYRDELDRGIEFLLGYVEAAGVSLDGPLVECACGRGRNALPLAARGHRVVGMDHALTALGLFRERADAEQARDRALPLQHDLRQAFPIRSGVAAAVLDITAIDNLVTPEHQAAYAAEIHRVLRPSGVVVIVTFDRDDGYYAPFLERDDAEGGVVFDPHTGVRNQLFLPADLDRLFGDGFERLAANRFDFIDEAAKTQWTRRFHLRMFRKLPTESA